MSSVNAFMAEIRLFSFSFPPKGWALCNGQFLPINQNQALFSLLGTTYGGNGQTTFALPNLQGRTPIHQGTSGGITYVLAETGGVEQVTLTTNQIPNHTHAFVCSTSSGASLSPDTNVPASGTAVTIYRPTPPAPAIAMNAAIQPQGGSQPHDNMQPYLCLNYIISLFGIFPSQN